MISRERFYECILTQDRNEYRFHVRAWNAREAEEEVCASLRENGVKEPGTLHVRNPKGVEEVTSSYAFGPA
jgi:hypothetical protein